MPGSLGYERADEGKIVCDHSKQLPEIILAFKRVMVVNPARLDNGR